MNQIAPKRARTDEQKTQRREAILIAASSLFEEVGFEAFSMAELGKRAGVAKGTLYLYFETREEVLLALHSVKLEAWAKLLMRSVTPGMSDSKFTTMFFDTVARDASLLPLLSRMESVIEHNISRDRLIEAKRFMAGLVDELAVTLSAALNLTRDRCADVITSLGLLILGAGQIDSGPAIANLDLPADVQEFMTAFSSRERFEVNARRIMAGIRAGI